MLTMSKCEDKRHLSLISFLIGVLLIPDFGEPGCGVRRSGVTSNGASRNSVSYRPLV